MLIQLLRNKYCLLLVLLASHVLCLGQGTWGKEFWVSFLPSHILDSANNNIEKKCYRLMVTAERECTASVANPNTGWDTTFTVSDSQPNLIDIPYSQAFYDQSNQIHNTGLHVAADDSISVWINDYWLINNYSVFQASYYEGTLVLPTHALGSEYYVQTGSATSKDRSMFSVVALEDGTVVDITVTDDTEDGPSSGTHFSVSLAAGQCYLLKSKKTEGLTSRNLTGTHVKARGGKRVAVFAGNLNPVVFLYQTPNHLHKIYGGAGRFVEQMPPITRWGTRFVVVGTKMQDLDSVRVTALYDKCVVRRNGSVLSIINAGQTLTFCNNSDTLADIIETSQPSMVSIAPLKKNVIFSNTKKEVSDKAIYFYYQRSVMPVVPLEQSVGRAVFQTVENLGDYMPTLHFAYVVAPTENVPGMRLDGRAIASSFSPVLGDRSLSYARMEIASGRHVLSCNNGGFVAQIEGGIKTLSSNPHLLPWDLHASYSFSVGSMMHDILAQVIVDGNYSGDTENGFWFCHEADPSFTLRTFFEVSHAEWDFGDGGTATGDTVTHHYQAEGDYTVSCDVYCLVHGHDSLMRTLTTSIHIQEPIEKDVWKTRCDSYYWHGTHCTESGVYPVMLQSLGGCDSLVNLHITILRSDTAYYTATACEEYRWRDSLYTESGRYLHLEGANGVGCDSVAVLELTVKRPVAFDIMGYTQVAHASDIWPGVYYYYAVDSTRLEKVPLVWECSNPEWRVVPKGDYSCALFVATTGQATLTATSYGCCASTGSVTLNATAFGLEEAAGSGVAIVPNPATGSVTVTAENLRKVEIHNPLGQPVASSDCDGDSVTIDLQSLPQGIYLVGITLNDGRRCTRQLVVQ